MSASCEKTALFQDGHGELLQDLSEPVSTCLRELAHPEHEPCSIGHSPELSASIDSTSTSPQSSAVWLTQPLSWRDSGWGKGRKRGVRRGSLPGTSAQMHRTPHRVDGGEVFIDPVMLRQPKGFRTGESTGGLPKSSPFSCTYSWYACGTWQTSGFHFKSS